MIPILTGRLIRESGNVLTASPPVTGLILAQWLGIFGRLTDTAGYGSARAVLVRLMVITVWRLIYFLR